MHMPALNDIMNQALCFMRSRPTLPHSDLLFGRKPALDLVLGFITQGLEYLCGVRGWSIRIQLDERICKCIHPAHFFPTSLNRPRRRSPMALATLGRPRTAAERVPGEKSSASAIICTARGANMLCFSGSLR
jgi:hypothetical protein